MKILATLFQRNNKLKYITGVVLTLCVIHLLPNSLVILASLFALWSMFFFPIAKVETIIFVIASVFFLGQNYSVLRVGGFTFTHQDILLMPYYEPFLWGFYFLTMKRFFAAPPRTVPLEKKAFIALLATAISFSFFSRTSETLLIASSISTLFLLLLFHTRYDLCFAAFALALGTVIEIFGVFTGLWHYPSPDILGVPYWFATMWISVGLLGWRLLIPLAEWGSDWTTKNDHAYKK